MLWTGGILQRAMKNIRAKKEDEGESVKKLRAAGAIIVCHTNISEMCLWFESFNRVYGRTLNPYDTRRTCGGSSGGEGALVSIPSY